MKNRKELFSKAENRVFLEKTADLARFDALKLRQVPSFADFPEKLIGNAIFGNGFAKEVLNRISRIASPLRPAKLFGF